MSVFNGLAEIFRSTFGEPVTYRPASGAPREISVIWIMPATVVSDDFAAGVIVDRPTVHIRVADLAAAPAENDEIDRLGVAWRVAAPPLPDGKGMTAVYVERAP